MSDRIVILRSHRRRLAKIIDGAGGIEGYDRARLFDLHERPLANLQDLAGLLHMLSARHDCAVVRGAIADPLRTRGVPRRLHPVGDEAPTLKDVPRHWLALDIDGLPLPESADPSDLPACARAVLPLLPPPFGAAACIVQATASHGIKPGARLRLWYWCNRPLSGADCKRWLANAPVDRSVFGAAQVIYTAAPIFSDGRADPLPHRLTLLPGAPMVTAPAPELLAPPKQTQAPPIGAGRFTSGGQAAPRGERYTLWAMARAIQAIRQASVGSRHATAMAEAWKLGRLLNAGSLAVEEFRHLVIRAMQHAGKPVPEAAGIADWVIARRGGAEVAP